MTLSQQDDFKNQPSMLETFIHSPGHECMFLPKFHCELNPIEMVCIIHSKHVIQVLVKSVSTGVGANTTIRRWRRKPLGMPRKQCSASLKNVQRVIQCFTNQSWQFMSAYHKGLTGATAAWTVCKQKQHWAINQTVMMAIDILMNPAALVAGVAKA